MEARRDRVSHIRNVAIIAHIDHGKSTLADRFLEITHAVSAREMRDQFLDKMDIERERGITIKAQTVRLTYKARAGGEFVINLIDTPGHVDFSYEVSRSLAACEGAILVVDSSQGIQAQTLANVYLALEHNLEVIPVLNKIDLPAADPEKTRREIEEVIGLKCEHAVKASAKEGIGIEEILENVVKLVPPPRDEGDVPLRAIIFDSWYDAYQGVIILVRVFDGEVHVGMRIRLVAVEKEFEVLRVGVMDPHPRHMESLGPGEVGFLVCNIKDVKDTRIGDTVTGAERPCREPLPGFKEIKPMVFCGIYPVEAHHYELLKEALERLALNDASFKYEPESSDYLGFGYRCGFLGLLHMEICQERLEREYHLDLISTAPTVVYRVITTKGDELYVENPSKLPPPQNIQRMDEPFVTITLHTPAEYIGGLLGICENRRGEQRKIDYLTAKHVAIVYDMPLSEMVFDFYDRVKSVSRGYASMDYQFSGYRSSNLVKLDILLNGTAVDALSLIVHRDKAYGRGRDLAKKLKEVIPRQMFEVAIQAAIGGKIIARETLSAMRKNVTAKCYGGDITRKRKLLEKQKEGKRRMKQIGNVEVPQEAFLAVLKID